MASFMVIINLQIKKRKEKSLYMKSVYLGHRGYWSVHPCFITGDTKYKKAWKDYFPIMHKHVCELCILCVIYMFNSIKMILWWNQISDLYSRVPWCCVELVVSPANLTHSIIMTHECVLPPAVRYWIKVPRARVGKGHRAIWKEVGKKMGGKGS